MQQPTFPAPVPLPSGTSHELLAWLLAQSAALVVAILWIVSMLRDRSSWTRERRELSSLLIQTIDNSWRDRWKERDAAALQLDSSQRNTLAAFTELAAKRRG